MVQILGESVTRRLLLTSVLAAALFGCGSSSRDDQLSNGDTLKVGELRQFQIKTGFTQEKCLNEEREQVDCISAEYIYLGLANQFSYAGEPRVIYGVNDLLIPSSLIEEPTVIGCGDQGKIVLFYVPLTPISTQKSTDGVIKEIIDDLIGNSTQRFSATIAADSTGPSLPIYFNTSRKNNITCEELFATEPILKANIR